MIQSPTDFEKLFVKIFGDVDRTSLSSLRDNRLRFELGDNESGLVRTNQSLDRSNQIVQYCFENLPIWLRIIFWDEDARGNLRNAGLNNIDADKEFKSDDNQDEEVLYLHYNKYSPRITEPIVTSIVNYEMAEEPAANITCYHINFEKAMIINVYDDRGMDVYSPNKQFINHLERTFSNWLI